MPTRGFSGGRKPPAGDDRSRGELKNYRNAGRDEESGKVPARGKKFV